MKTQKQFFAVAILSVLSVLLLASCRGTAATTAPDRLTEIIKAGKITVCVAPEVPPIIWKDPATGAVVGLSMDLNNKLAESLKVKLEVVELPWNGLIPALLAGKCDYIGSGMCKMTNRAQTVNFTPENEYAYTSSVLVLTNNTKVKSLGDLNNPDVTVATLIGSGNYTQAQDLWPKAKLSSFDSYDLLVAAVVNGQIDAAFESTNGMFIYEKNHPTSQFTMWVVPGADCNSGWEVRTTPDNDHLLMYLNNFLQFEKVSGEWYTFHDKWLTGVPVSDNLYK